MDKKDKKNQKISVIIPAYNEEKTVSKSIESMLNQTMLPDEIIVVDDGSKDRTYQIAKSYPPPVKVFRTEHKGAGATRNFGVRNSTGDIIFFFDADMTAPPNYIQALATPIINGEAQGTVAEDELVVNPDNIWAKCWTIEWKVPADKRVSEDSKCVDSDVFRAIKREIFLSCGGFDENVGYCDDAIGKKLGVKSKHVQGVVCYHSNPSTLKEVFAQAVWIGRGIINTFVKISRRKKIAKIISRLLKHSIMSIPNGLRYSIKHREPRFLIFKIIYDAGTLYGLLTFLIFGKTAK